MAADAILRDFARAAIRDRKLPNRNPARIWMGRGVARRTLCAACPSPVRRRSWCSSSRARMTLALTRSTFTSAASCPGQTSANGGIGRDDLVSGYWALGLTIPVPGLRMLGVCRRHLGCPGIENL